MRWGKRPPPPPPPSSADFVTRRVVIHTKDDRSVRGLLIGSHVDCFVLGVPEYLNEAQSVDVPGSVVVLKSNVSTIQVLEA